MVASPIKPTKSTTRNADPGGLAATPDTPAHLSGLIKCANNLVTSDGHQIDVWELNVPSDASYLSEWAAHFRQHYCPDSTIDSLRAGTGLTRAEYLIQLIFPDQAGAPGPSIRAGDFAELLVADYVEFLLGFWVPRGKYANKESRNESAKGVDIIGFQVASPLKPSSKDILLAFEVKAQFSGKAYKGRLQDAIDDSYKDYLRRAISLNAIKRRLLEAHQNDRALIVQRFQNPSDNPYTYRSGAAAVLSDLAYDETQLQQSTTTATHQGADNLELIVIRGKELMKLVHTLYERAANEA